MKWNQLARFVIAGAFNTAFSYAIYAAGLRYGLAYPVANFLSLVGGVCMGFVTQGRYVFRRFEFRRFPIFALTWLMLWCLNVVLIWGVLPFVGDNAYAAGAATTAAMVFLSFLIQKHLVFADKSAR